MTEAEIMKDLKSAAEWFTEHGRNTNTAIIGICERAIDLINRKNAEIERLKADKYLYTEDGKIELLPRTDLDQIGADARAEAIKEFAEMVKKSALNAAFLGEVVFVGYIDQIAKEMGVE